MTFDQLQIKYESQTLPAPYAISCKINIKWPGIGLKLNYLGREDLSEEEIYEEGFTMQDDFEGHTDLGQFWEETLVEAYEKTTIQRKPPKEDPPFTIELAFSKNGESQKKGKPSEYGMWEYLVQELMQATFEGCKTEKPFWLQATRIHNGQSSSLEIKASFLEREASLSKQGKTTPISWEKLRQYMKIFFQPDYLPEEATSKDPKGNGYYIQTEPGIWYQIGKSIANPTEDSDLTGKLKGLIDELLD